MLGCIPHGGWETVFSSGGDMFVGTCFVLCLFLLVFYAYIIVLSVFLVIYFLCLIFYYCLRSTRLHTTVALYYIIGHG